MNDHRGIVDTLAIMLSGPLVHRDELRLKTWDMKTFKGVTDEKNGLIISDTNGYKRFTRWVDRLRVIRLKHDTVIEVSLPRFCGQGNNIDVAALDQSRLFRALFDLKRTVIPWTSELTRMQMGWSIPEDENVPDCWWVRRLDLAINFKGPVQVILEAYAKTKYHRVRGSPVRYPNSLVWEGENWRLTVYDKGTEQGGEPNEIGRVELQLRSKKSLEILGLSLPYGGDLIFPDGTSRMLSLPHLHGFLRREIQSLEPTESSFPVITTPAEAGIWFAAIDPRVYESLRCHLSKRQFRRVHKKIEAQKALLNPSIRLADLCWPSIQTASRAGAA